MSEPIYALRRVKKPRHEYVTERCDVGGRFGIRPLAWLCTIAASYALIGCASVPPPTDQLAVSRSALDDARGAGAQQLAPREFNDSRSKLEQAETAVNREEYQHARSLAEEAEVDARLAQRKSQNMRSQQALEEIQAGTRALQQELQRSVK